MIKKKYNWKDVLYDDLTNTTKRELLNSFNSYLFFCVCQTVTVTCIAVWLSKIQHIVYMSGTNLNFS